MNAGGSMTQFRKRAPLVIQVFCMYCGKAFRKVRRKKPLLSSGVRTSSSLTCSKECSRNYSFLTHCGRRKDERRLLLES
jgi:hypothetical protein